MYVLNNDYKHIYRLNDEDLNSRNINGNFKLIIFDGFPYLSSDMKLIDVLDKEKIDIPIIYFQNSINHNVSINFLKNEYNVDYLYSTTPKIKSIDDTKNSATFNQIRYNNIPDIITNHEYFGGNNIEMLFSDSTTAIVESNGDYAIFINDLFPLSLKEISIETLSSFSEIIGNLLYFLVEKEQILNIRLKKREYLINESITVLIELNDRFKGSNLNLFIIEDKDTISYPIGNISLDSMRYDINFNKPGIKELYSTVDLINGNTISGKSQYININDYNFEMISSLEK